MGEHTFDTYRDLTVGGGPLRVYPAGPAGGGTPVVLLHGAMLDCAQITWRHLQPTLARDRAVVSVDLPRHGGSRPWTGLLDQRRLAEVLVQLLDRLELDRVDLVGLSMGGGLAIGLALEHPERVRRLVLTAPGGLDTVRPWQFLTWLYGRSGTLLRWTSAFLAGSPRLLRSSMTRAFAAGAQNPDFTGVMRLVEAEALARRQHREAALDDWQVASFGPRRMRLCYLPELHRLTAPSLWLRGADDPLVSAEVMRRAVAAAPDARLETVTRAGHLLPLDQPARFAQLVVDFLDG